MQVTHTKHAPTIDDLIGLPEPSDAQISPHGDHVAYVVRTADWERNEYLDQVWIADVAQSGSHPLTLGTQSSSSPCWSPDGRWLSFLSQRDNEPSPALYLVSPSGGEAHRLAELESGGYRFAWSPDGRSIAYIAPALESVEQKQRRERDGEVCVADEDVAGAQLWLLRVADGTCHQLTGGGALHVTGFDWHPSSACIAFTACPTPDGDDWDRGRLYTIALDTGQVAPFLSEGGCSLPRWSPDGTQIAFSRCGNPSYVAVNVICIVPARGGRIRTLKPFDGETRLLDWGPDGLYLLALKRTSSHLFCVNPESGAVVQLTPDDLPGWAITEGWIGLGCGFTPSFSHTAFVSYDVGHYAEVTVLDTIDETICRITDFTAGIRSWSLGQSELFRWTAPDGVPIEGILTKPPGFDSSKRYPLVVVVHGGPTYTSLLPPLSDGDHWYCAIPQLVNKGALILQPNYRGSTGYGETFRALNVGTLGLTEYGDVVSGVDALIERGWVDPLRVGTVGMSHGGYLSAFLATYGDRFRAAVMLSGISDWVLNYCSTDTGGWMRQYLQSTPWEDPEIYRTTSPLAYIQQAKTPVLIQHGEADDRAPVANAHALYRGLKDVGVEARLVLYPGMGHGMSRPRQFRRLMRGVVDWFERWLWGEDQDGG